MRYLQLHRKLRATWPMAVGALLIALVLIVTVWLFWLRAPWQVHTIVVLLTVLIVVTIGFVPRAWGKLRLEGASELEVAKVEEDFRKNVAQLMTALAVVGGGIYLWSAADFAAREDRINNRFKLAVDQLTGVDAKGAKAIEARLAAIYSLESIARQSPADSPLIVTMLLAYVRRAREDLSDGEWSRRCNGPSTARRDNHDDFTAALVAARRLSSSERRAELDLSEIVLHDAKLNGIDLTRVRLYRAILIGVGLFRARLDEANLEYVNVRDGDLREAVLRDASLSGACLRGTEFTGADLQRARLWGARADRASFDGARLKGADFRGADLRRVSFENADLTGVTFLIAVLAGANFKGADVNDADFRGVDLSRALNLSPEQLGRARIDEKTRPPEGSGR